MPAALTVGADDPQQVTPVVARVPVAPIPFPGSDGKTHAVYELFLTNAGREAATIDQIEVLDADDGTVVETLDNATLTPLFSLANGQPTDEGIGSGQSGTVYLHLVFDSAADVPAVLTHDIAVTFPTQGSFDQDGIATVAVDDRPVLELGPPLKGERYIAADGCCDSKRHRRATLPVNGTQSIAQRYAIDWEQMDEEGRIYTGDPLDVNNYAIYGEEALAMADGTVVKVVDGLPEQVPGTYPENPTLEEVDGNSVVLDVGGGYFVNYAHLQNGSITVKVGDKVTMGDVVGLVGNTGNSVAPHLHIHVMDTPLPVAASGFPYTINAFTVFGITVSTAAFDTAEAEGTPLEYDRIDPPTSHTNQYPMDQSLVNF